MIKRDEKGRIMMGSSNAWNKGMKIKVNTGRTHFKKGNKLNAGRIPWNKGKKRPEMIGNKLNWKGGTTKIVALIRSMDEYLFWRSAVFQRDNWTCQTCGLRGVYLEAHHKKELIRIVIDNKIISVEDAKKCIELWDINNGVTLCEKCHNLTKYGRIDYGKI